MPRENARPPGAVVGIDGDTVLTTPVRKERLKRSKKELAEEAAKVISQADKIECVANERGTLPEKFYTLPNRKRNKTPQKDYPSYSLDRRSHKRRNSAELQPPKKPPRTFATGSNTDANTNPKSSIFDLLKKIPEKPNRPKKSNLKRSVSDATSLKSPGYDQAAPKKAESDSEESTRRRSNNKKQLSPIIEVTQREDYFSGDNKENIKIPEVSTPKSDKQTQSVTEQLRDYIAEIDEELYKETGIRITTPSPIKKDPEPIIIDLDKAENISRNKKHKLNFGLGKKIKSLTYKKPKSSDNHHNNVLSSNKERENEINRNSSKTLEIISHLHRKEEEEEESKRKSNSAPVVERTIQDLHNTVSADMIHSSQKPAERPPLTKGKTVNTMVKRLSSDACSSPPPTRTNVLIMPNISVQHNNNQPFSYTRGISPDKYRSNEDLPQNLPNTSPTKPVIYAQVVCGAKDNAKQTIHRAYTGRRQPQSDSDEGLGGEDSSGITRKYENEKSFTRFGDDQLFDSETEKLLDEIDKYKAESPILPKYRSPLANGFTNYRGEIMERGRADGMDAKRRESLTEKDFTQNSPVHVRGDLSARRDRLESRINRRLTEKPTPSPEYYPGKNTSRNNLYISEKSEKVYRSGSTSPVGYKEKYIAKTESDMFGERRTESRTKKYFGDPKDQKNFKHSIEHSDTEPKSMDYQISDYRSSPENQSRFESSHNNYSRTRYRTEKPKLLKDKSVYRSTPEIHNGSRTGISGGTSHNAYHDSLPREDGSLQRFRSERFLNREESDRRTDRFVDSGIENDCRRDSSENYQPTRPIRSRPDFYNESEDEGFASSLLITNEKHHTDSNHVRKSRKDFESAPNSRNEYYRETKSKYVPRERSIDDGSHFDPRLDKDVNRTVVKSAEKKPPKPDKKSSLEKVKSLFTRDKKKDKTSSLQKSKTRSLHSRQVLDEEQRSVKSGAGIDYKNRRRLSTPSPTRDAPKKAESIHGSWFKSLDRLTKRKSEKHKEANFTSTEDEGATVPGKLSSSASNLRFFGDTDQESNSDSVNGVPNSKKKSGFRSQSSRDLHNISEETRSKCSNLGRKSDHKSFTSISETERDIKGSRTSLKPPMSPTRGYLHDSDHREHRKRRNKRHDISSVESSTEGDSSQQSQRSIVYLHAATVGDIPGPGYLKSNRASREDLTSNGSSFIQPQVKTLSRSFSVLAPWRPRHPREGMDIDYTQYNKGYRNGKYEQKTAKSTSHRNENSTLKKKANDTKKNGYQQSLSRRTKSKESLPGLRQSREELSRGSTSTLYKKKDKLPRENSRYVREKEDRRMTTKSQSVESIARKSKQDGRDVSRSVSMPRDTGKSAGWFKKSKKSSNHRL